MGRTYFLQVQNNEWYKCQRKVKRKCLLECGWCCLPIVSQARLRVWMDYTTRNNGGKFLKILVASDLPAWQVRRKCSNIHGISPTTISYSLVDRFGYWACFLNEVPVRFWQALRTHNKGIHNLKQIVDHEYDAGSCN